MQRNKLPKPPLLPFDRQRRWEGIEEYEKAMAAKSPRTALKELNPTNLSGGGASGGNSRDQVHSILL